MEIIVVVVFIFFLFSPDNFGSGLSRLSLGEVRMNFDIRNVLKGFLSFSKMFFDFVRMLDSRKTNDARVLLANGFEFNFEDFLGVRVGHILALIVIKRKTNIATKRFQSMCSKRTFGIFFYFFRGSKKMTPESKVVGNGRE